MLGPASAEALPHDLIPEALRLARPGDRTLVIRDGGAALVELVSIEAAAARPFEAVREDVEARLRSVRAQEALRAEVERLRAAVAVEVDEAMLQRRSADAR